MEIGRCLFSEFCGNPLNGSLEHFWPESLGGLDADSRTDILCSACNKRFGDSTDQAVAAFYRALFVKLAPFLKGKLRDAHLEVKGADGRGIGVSGGGTMRVKPTVMRRDAGGAPVEIISDPTHARAVAKMVRQIGGDDWESAQTSVVPDGHAGGWTESFGPDLFQGLAKIGAATFAALEARGLLLTDTQVAAGRATRRLRPLAYLGVQRQTVTPREIWTGRFDELKVLAPRFAEGFFNRVVVAADPDYGQVNVAVQVGSTMPVLFDAGELDVASPVTLMYERNLVGPSQHAVSFTRVDECLLPERRVRDLRHSGASREAHEHGIRQFQERLAVALAHATLKGELENDVYVEEQLDIFFRATLAPPVTTASAIEGFGGAAARIYKFQEDIRSDVARKMEEIVAERVNASIVSDLAAVLEGAPTSKSLVALYRTGLSAVVATCGLPNTFQFTGLKVTGR